MDVELQSTRMSHVPLLHEALLATLSAGRPIDTTTCSPAGGGDDDGNGGGDGGGSASHLPSSLELEVNTRRRALNRLLKDLDAAETAMGRRRGIPARAHSPKRAERTARWEEGVAVDVAADVAHVPGGRDSEFAEFGDLAARALEEHRQLRRITGSVPLLV